MFQIDDSLHWTDHFVKYGFAVLRGQVGRDFTTRALEQVRQHVVGDGRDLPFDQWTTENIRREQRVPGDPVLDAVFDQPGVRDIIHTMFGTDQVGAPTGWSGKPLYQIFVNPFNPDATPHPLQGGHIDFGGHLIPKFGDAFVMQVALHETEPMGGNITAIPGSHVQVQKRAIDDPYTQYPYDFKDFVFEAPYEFVAQPGDVFLMHHLLFHSGNPCCGPTRKPRIALHCQVQRSTFLTLADPADASNPPWVRSFTLNGRVEDPDDEQRYIRFSEAKTSMWGVWTSEDQRTSYKVYTWVDGALRAKVRTPDGQERLGRAARFDGRELSFEQVLPADAAAGGRETACRATLQREPGDEPMMRCTLAPVDGGEPRTMRLRRTEVFTSRIVD